MVFFKKQWLLCGGVNTRSPCETIGLYSLMSSMFGIYFLMFCILGKGAPMIIRPFVENGTYNTLYKISFYWMLALMLNLFGSMLVAVGITTKTQLYIWPFFATFLSVVAFQLGFSVWLIVTFTSQVNELITAGVMLAWMMYNLYLVVLLVIHVHGMKDLPPPPETAGPTHVISEKGPENPSPKF